MAHVIAESRKLSFSEVNRIARNVPTREIARSIASNEHLQSVVVDEVLDIEKKRSVYDAIHGNDSVQKLTFNGVNPFVVDGLHRLCRMKSVEEVNLLRITVTEHLALFHPTRNLCKLNVDGGNMGDAAAQAVSRLLHFRCCLRSVRFKQCGLSSEGIAVFGQFLQKPSALKVVTVATRNVVLRSHAIEAFAQGIEMNTSIEVLAFRFPHVSETEGKRLFRAVRVNTTLKVASIVLRKELGREEAVEAARLIKKNRTLKGLDLVSKSEHIGLIADALAVNDSLQMFDCYHTDTDGIRCICDGLTQNDSVKRLKLLGGKITSGGIPTPIIPICDLLSSNSTLTSLAFYKCFIEECGYVSLGRALQQNVSLEALELTSCTGVTDRGVRALLEGVKVHPTLKKVEISPLSNPSYQDEIDFYMERNTRAQPILDANDLPLSIWPRVLKRANDCRHVEDRLVAPNMLYFFVKEKCELFRRAPSSRKRKRSTNA